MQKYRVQLKRPLLGENQKTASMDRQTLIQTIASVGARRVMKIRFDSPGIPNGTNQLDGKQMLKLWQEVEKLKSSGLGA